MEFLKISFVKERQTWDEREGTFLLDRSPEVQHVHVLQQFGAVGAIAAGGAYTTVRYLGLRGERGPFIVFFFSAFSCLAVLPYILLNYEPMTFKQLCMLLLAGLAASGGQFGVTYAYKYAPAREISIYDYTQVIFAAVLGFIVFGQLPDAFSLIGYTIICGVSILMYIYNMEYFKKK